MLPDMEEVTISAVVGELASRALSFLIDACSRRVAAPAPPSSEETLDGLRRLLLRVGAVVEDAEGRRITNQAMLQQLSTLRQELQRGQFTLDALRCQSHHHGRNDEAPTATATGHRSFTLSRFNPAKRLCTWNSSGERHSELRRVLARLEATVRDAAEFVLLSGRYPRLTRQPYSAYLVIDNSMFGRQMEMEHVIGFLLQGADEDLGVLPIVGPRKVGKSTLAEHACMDERVRSHFSRIMFLSGADLSNEQHTVSLADGAGVITKHKSRPASSGGRALMIVELDRDISGDSWHGLYGASRAHLPRGSKIIVTSRSDMIAGFGTTPPLRLRFLTPEAYWYFFKARAFGSVDVAAEHPEVASVAMDMAGEMGGCFIGASIFVGMLRSRPLDVGAWRLGLEFYREFRRRNDFLYANPADDSWELARPMRLPIVKETSSSPGYVVVVGNYQTSSVPGESAACMVSLQDVMLGSARPQGRFAALAWRSHIPPHYSYVYTCELRRKPAATTVVSRNKRVRKISG